MDANSILGMIGAKIGLSATTLMFMIWAVTQAAKLLARSIPNNATGTWAVIRNISVYVGMDPSSKVAPGFTVQDAAAIIATTPPTDQKAAAVASTGTPPVVGDLKKD